MTPVNVPIQPDAIHGAVAWLYVATNSARVFGYVPQILAIHRCRDGVPAISLLTWLSWLVSHMTAVLYGALIVHDPFFLLVSVLNLTGCSVVTSMVVARRRAVGGQKQNGPLARPVSAWRGS